MSYNYTEGTIRNNIIPQLITQIEGMAAGPDRDRAVTQLDVWYQTLAMNDSIKANAPYEVVRNFDGGGNGQDFALSSSTSESYAINYEAQLEAGLSFEFGVNIGGSGITTGGSAKFQNGYGRGTSGSNVSTNTVQYHLEDANSDDHFAVNVFRDEVFGTYVFRLDSTASETSCPYEGGYRIDQPELSVGTQGNTRMVVNEAPIGSPVNFPLYICNNSNTELTYNIKVRGGTNTEGGIVVVLGENISSDILGQECEAVPANGCYDITNLTLTDPNPSDEFNDFEIEVYLYSACEPSIRSSVILEAHFGPGNFGAYCTPYSEGAGTVGDHINGVQIGNIDNTGTGATPTPGYVDYSGTFSTPLPRNAQRVLAITSGPQVGTQYTAFIDYDRNNIFEDNERIGSFTNTLPGEVGNLAFTVPGTALLGSTVMRVRGVREDGASIFMVDACYSHTYGETEDYAVVINGSTPQDCAGVDNGTALPGTPCNDNNADTGNDTWNANCQCAGLILDCTGTPGGGIQPGTPCNDNNPDTGGDAYNANCACAGQPYDCTGIPGGSATVGTACNDNNGATGNDVYDAECQCVGQPFDCLGIAGGTTIPGTPCNDNDPATSGDVFTANCICAGTLAEDCNGVAGGTAQPGTPCDDGNASTGNDVYDNACDCAGLPLDCAGVPGGSAAPGTPCNDGSVLTENDVYNSDCVCMGIAPNDCLGVAGGPAQPGTPCDDGNPNSGNDAYTVFCQCVGQLIDCEGTAGGMALPGVPCDDGNAATQNDTYTLGCACEGQSTTGISDEGASAPTFSVQPNPSTGVFTLNNPAQVATRIEVRDAVGRIVMQPMLLGSSRASSIDLSGLASGTYHLVARTEGHQQVIKIMVQR
ncbi:MAG TPA: GEVED domain-containing protein, partial [Flavobacteriales bacterium]